MPCVVFFLAAVAAFLSAMQIKQQVTADQSQEMELIASYTDRIEKEPQRTEEFLRKLIEAQRNHADTSGEFVMSVAGCQQGLCWGLLGGVLLQLYLVWRMDRARGTMRTQGR